MAAGNRRHRASFLATLATALLAVAAAQAQQPKTQPKAPEPTGTAVVGMFPAGAKAGTTTAVTVHGARLTGAAAFWCSHPGITAAVKPGGTDVKVDLDLKVAADVPAGLYEWRIFADRGASPQRLLAIDNREESVVKKAAADAIVPLAPEVVFNGSLEKYQDTDTFSFTAKPGERWLFVLQCRALGMPCEPALAISAPDGRLLAAGKQKLEGDPFLDYTFAESLQVRVQVWNLLPGDVPGRAYRLVATRRPVLEYAFPAGGKAGSQAAVTLGARDPGNALGGKPDAGFAKLEVPVTFPKEGPLAFRVPGKPTVNALDLDVDDLPEVLEVEPNDNPDAATPAAVPSVINGRFHERGDVDHIAVTLKKGEKVVLDLTGRSLGNPGDLILSVFDAKGAALVSNDDRSPTDSDPKLEFTAPADGKFVVRVQDVVPQRTAGPKYLYRLKIRSARPDFALAVESSTILLKPPGGSVTVNVDRMEGFDEEIALSVEGLPADVKATAAAIAKGAKTGKVDFTAAGDRSLPIRIVGKAKVGGADRTHAAVASGTVVPELVLTTEKLVLSVSTKEAAPTTPTTPAGAATVVTVIPASAPGWKYVAATTVKGEAWIQAAFDDKAWTAGKAPVGYGEDAIAAKQGTMLALTGQTVLFRREFMVDAKAVAGKFKLLVASDDSAIVYINGKAVDKDEDDHEPVYWNRTVMVPAGIIVAGRNVVAVQLNNKAGSGDALLDLQLEAEVPADAKK